MATVQKDCTCFLIFHHHLLWILSFKPLNMRVCLISHFLQVAYIKILTLNVYDLVIYISVNSFSEATYMLTDIYINTGSRFGQELGLKKKIKSIIFWLIAGPYMRQIIHNSSPFFLAFVNNTLWLFIFLWVFEWRRGEQQW